MTKTILVTSEKGGVGKSTTAVHLAAALADMGFIVLLMDLDPRGDAAILLRAKPGRQAAVWFSDDYDEPELTATDVVIQTYRAGLDLLPSNYTLAGANASLAAGHIPSTAIADRLLRLGRNYGIVVVDANASSGQLRDAALLAADLLIIPSKTDFLGLNSINPLLRAAATTGLDARVLPTMYDGREVAQRKAIATMQDEWRNNMMKGLMGPLFIPDRAEVKAAAMARQLLFEYEPHGTATIAYRSLGEFVSENIGAAINA